MQPLRKGYMSVTKGAQLAASLISHKQGLPGAEEASRGRTGRQAPVVGDDKCPDPVALADGLVEELAVAHVAGHRIPLHIVAPIPVEVLVYVAVCALATPAPGLPPFEEAVPAPRAVRGSGLAVHMLPLSKPSWAACAAVRLWMHARQCGRWTKGIVRTANLDQMMKQQHMFPCHFTCSI